MTLGEKSDVDQAIAEAQMEIDPEAQTTNAPMVGITLIKNGFHPAFQKHDLINGLEAFEELKAAAKTTTCKK